MKKTFSVEELVWAFIEHADDARRAVAVSIAGEPWGYVRIMGPSGDHQVLIERYNATVCLAEIHSSLPGVERRPSAKIENDPLGQSSGPNTPPFSWAISAKKLREHYNAPAAFVEAIVRACAEAGTPW